MYSKPLLRKYIREGLHRKGWTDKQLADALSITPSNLSRALNTAGFNLTLPQFSQVTALCDITPDQAYHILTGRRAKEASADLLLTYAKKIVQGL